MATSLRQSWVREETEDRTSGVLQRRSERGWVKGRLNCEASWVCGGCYWKHCGEIIVPERWPIRTNQGSIYTHCQNNKFSSREKECQSLSKLATSRFNVKPQHQLHMALYMPQFMYIHVHVVRQICTFTQNVTCCNNIIIATELRTYLTKGLELTSKMERERQNWIFVGISSMAGGWECVCVCASRLLV